MNPTQRLSRLVATARGDLVLPLRPRAAADVVALPLRLADALDLGASRWVCVVIDADGGQWTVPVVEGSGEVRRAIAGDGVAAALVTMLAGSGEPASPAFVMRRWRHPLPDNASKQRKLLSEAGTHERSIAVDQTNDSIVVGERAVVKWAVRLPADHSVEQPAARRLGMLADHGFSGIPATLGMLQWTGSPPHPALLASVTEFLPGAVDGWTWAVDDVRAFAAGDVAADTALLPARQLGVLVAGMHVAFASSGRAVADEKTTQRWRDRANHALDDALRLVDGPEGERLARRAPRIRAAFETFLETSGTPLIDVHGDLHVGQVLRHGSPSRYALIDFDGNPVTAIEEGARRQPVALDVAGMLASLDHVGRVVIKRTDGVDVDAVLAWIGQAQATFFAAYRSALLEAGAGALLDDRVIRPLQLEQECREFIYAVRHLPHWRYVPDAALSALLPDEE